MNGITIALIVVAVWLIGAIAFAYGAGKYTDERLTGATWLILLLWPVGVAFAPIALLRGVIFYASSRGRDHRENRRNP